MSEELAIDGGDPVRTKLLPYGHQTIDDDDVQAVVDVLRGEWLTTGPAVSQYEAAFAQYVGAKHAVAVSSGTAALHLSMLVSGIKSDDEVITSPMTFAATANCIRYCDGCPVFADLNPRTCNIDVESVRKLAHGRTKAIIAVDFAGQPADLDELSKIASENDAVFIEDAAHSLGATYKGRRVGSIADITTFSTHPVKNITTGEGGVVTTESDEVAAKVRAARNHGIKADAHVRAAKGDWFYTQDFLGYNYRIPDVLCALGSSQLNKLDAWLERRAAIARRYNEAFDQMPQIKPLMQAEDRQSANHLYVIRLCLDQLTADREQFFKALRAEGIGCNVHYIPVYWHPYYESMGFFKGLCPVAERQYECILSLPIWPGMNDNDTKDAITAVQKVASAYSK